MNELQKAINSIPEEYAAHQSIETVMEVLAEFILDFTMHRLCNDPDLCSEFYLESYSFFPKILERYAAFPKKDEVAFLPYLVTSLRHEFMNFVRKARRQGIALEDDIPVDLAKLSHHSLHPDFVYDADDTTRHRLSREVSRLPMKLRLPTKLYFGLELGMDELEALLDCHEEATDAADFLRDYRKRRAIHLQELRSLQDRLRRVNHKLHLMEESENQSNEPLIRRCQHRKKKLLHIMERMSGIYKYEEIGSLLGASKSTIMRRIRQAQDAVRSGLIQSARKEGEIQTWNMQTAS